MRSMCAGCRLASLSTMTATCWAASRAGQIGIQRRCSPSSNPLFLAVVSSRLHPAEHVAQEQAAAAQPLLVDRVTDARAGYRLDRNPGLCERGFGTGERAVWNERIVGAVNEQCARPLAQLARQQFGCDQPAREADDAGDWLRTAETDEQRHHRA